MPRAPRGKRVDDSSTGAFMVVNRAQRGQPDPFFDKSRNVWVAPWRKANGRMGRPTGRTRAAAEASRDRHVAAELDAAKFAPLSSGFHADTTLTELSRWWLDHVARHRVRVTTWSTYDKQLRVVNERLGDVPVRKLRPENVAGVIGAIAQSGSTSRARNIRMLLVQLLDEAVNLGLAEDNVAKKVRSPRVPKVQRRTLSPAEVARHRRPAAPPAGNYSLQRRSRCWRRTMTAGSACAESGSCRGPRCRIRVSCSTSSS